MSRTYLIRDELNGPRALEFARAIKVPESGTVVFDLRESAGIDVHGLAIMVRVYGHLLGQNGCLRIKNASREIRTQMTELGIWYKFSS